MLSVTFHTKDLKRLDPKTEETYHSCKYINALGHHHNMKLFKLVSDGQTSVNYTTEKSNFNVNVFLVRANFNFEINRENRFYQSHKLFSLSEDIPFKINSYISKSHVQLIGVTIGDLFRYFSHKYEYLNSKQCPEFLIHNQNMFQLDNKKEDMGQLDNKKDKKEYIVQLDNKKENNYCSLPKKEYSVKKTKSFSKNIFDFPKSLQTVVNILTPNDKNYKENVKLWNLVQKGASINTRKARINDVLGVYNYQQSQFYLWDGLRTGGFLPKTSNKFESFCNQIVYFSENTLYEKEIKLDDQSVQIVNNYSIVFENIIGTIGISKLLKYFLYKEDPESSNNTNNVYYFSIPQSIPTILKALSKTPDDDCDKEAKIILKSSNNKNRNLETKYPEYVFDNIRQVPKEYPEYALKNVLVKTWSDQDSIDADRKFAKRNHLKYLENKREPRIMTHHEKVLKSGQKRSRKRRHWDFSNKKGYNKIKYNYLLNLYNEDTNLLLEENLDNYTQTYTCGLYLSSKYLHRK